MISTTAGFLLLLPLAACAAAAAAVFLLRPGDRDAPTGGGTSRAGLAMRVLLPAAAFLAAVQLHTAYGLTTDDAPITFRYAENLATGAGFAYNPGETVLGTSTPLFTLALAGLRAAGVPVPVGALLLNLVAITVALWLVERIARRLFGPGAGLIAAAAAATEAPFLVYTTQGMETTCFVALLLGAFDRHLAGRDTAAGVLAGLSAVMRLDGLTSVAALGLDHLRRRRVPAGFAAGFGLVALPWFAWSALHFGSVFPQSMLAKLAHTKHSEPLWLLRSLLLEGTMLFVPFGLIGSARCLARGSAEDDRAGRALALPLWLVLYVAAYSFAGIDAYPWYRIPPVPVLAVLAGGGIAACAEGWLALRGAPPRALRQGTLVACMLAAFAVRSLAYRDSLGAYDAQLRVWEAPRVASAEWLALHAPAGSSVASSAIGHIGWISRLKVFDTSGLVTKGTATDPASLRPDFIVGHDGDPRPGELFRVTDPAYELVQSIAVEKDVVYRIYKRSGVALR